VLSTADRLAERTKHFSVRLLKFLRTLPQNPVTDVVVRQLAKSGTGVAANYRSTRRSRSKAEFIARLGVVVEEVDESEHWLEIARDVELASGEELEWLLAESHELRAVFVASLTTARLNQKQ
jgi:four helix bundle protein